MWGYAYFRTGSLWTAWAAHTLTNTSLNLLHVATADALDAGMSIRMTTFRIVSLLMILVIRYLADRRNISEMPVWDTADGDAPLLGFASCSSHPVRLRVLKRF